MELPEAQRHCEDITRRSASSFHAAFWMLPKPKRRALYAVYAFCRLADDIADDPAVRGDRGRLLERWRQELEAAYLGKSEEPVGIALGDAVQRFALPREHFQELLRGVEADLCGQVFTTFEELERYCHDVASTVGLLVVRVLGFRNPRSLEYADAMGIAVQLTNVIRDVAHDARSGRVYLPSEDLERFGVAPAMLSADTQSDALRLLLGSYAERARLHYERAALLLPEEDRVVLRPAEAMGRIYRALLEEIQRQGFPCRGEPVRLSRAWRLAIAACVWLGVSGRGLGSPASSLPRALA